MNSRTLKLNIAIVVLAICFILATSKPVNAQQAGYSHICYQTSSAALPTIDGQWGSEWNSGLQTTFGTNTNFTDEWYLAASNPSVAYYYLLIETMDTSNETGDFVQICFNGGMTVDSAPSSTDFAINFTSNAVCTWYRGNGVGWTQIATPSSSVFRWSGSFSPSPTYSTPHLILEMSLLKTSTELGGSQIIGPEFWMLLQTYDAHSAGSAVESWPTVPPSSPDVPKTYGDITYSMGAAPNYVQGTNQTPNATPTPTPSSTPVPTQKASPTPTIVYTPNPATNQTATSTPNSTQTPSPTPQLEKESSFSSWDILFVLAIISAESVVVVIYRTAPPKKLLIGHARNASDDNLN